MPLSLRSPWAFSPAGLGTSAMNPFTGTELSSKLGNWEQRENSLVGRWEFWGGSVFGLGAELHQGCYPWAACASRLHSAADDVILF